MDWEKIRDSIVDIGRTAGKDFLAKHPQAEAILKERATRLAKLAALYAVSKPADQEKVLQDMKVVRQTIENDLAALAVDASAEAHATFTRIIGIAFETVVKTLPSIVALL